MKFIILNQRGVFLECETFENHRRHADYLKKVKTGFTFVNSGQLFNSMVLIEESVIIHSVPFEVF